MKIVTDHPEEDKPVLVDKELLAEFKTAPEKAFEKIVKRYQERIYWQIRRLVKNHEDAADVMQNVFIKTWKGLENFREESNLYTWIYRIAFNESHTFLTKRSKKATQDLDEPVFENYLATDGNEIEGEEIERILFAAIETLPEKQKQVFQLRYFDEMKFQEISELLGTSVGALKTSYHIAAKKIEEIIKSF